MKKDRVVAILIMLALFTMAITYPYFSTSDLFMWFTGNAVSQTTNLNISLAQNTPVVINVTNISTQSIAEAGMFGVQFNFTVLDIDGTGALNGNSANGTVNLTGEASRSNSTCAKIYDVNSTVSTFWCNVTMFWFDGPGTWTINASINTTNGLSASNNSINFTLSSTTAFVLSPTSLTWPTVKVGQTNKTSNNDPLVLNNTGNANITFGNVNISAFDLFGETTKTQFINSSNITVNTVTSSDVAPNVECAASTTTSGAQMANNTGTNITGAGLAKGNFTQAFNNITSGQQSLYFCLTLVIQGNSAGLSQQAYSTLALGAWMVRI